jgi:ribosomal protein L29
MAKKKTTTKTEAVANKVAKAPKKVDYKSMNQDDLNKAIKGLREDTLTLKKGTVTREVQNVRAYSYRRKELARALTALNSISSKEEQ